MRACIDPTQGPGSVDVPPNQKAQRRRRQEQRLHRQARNRPQSRLLAQHAVAAPTPRQGQRDPGYPTGLGHHGTHPDRRQTHGDPLHPTQLFVQQKPPRQHAEERHQKVAQTGFDNVARIDAPDVHEPVGRQQQRRQHQPSGTPDRGQRRHRRTPPLSPAHHQQAQQGQRPEVPMRDEFQRVDRRQAFPIQRHQAPEQVATHRGQRPGTGRSPRCLHSPTHRPTLGPSPRC